MEQIGVDAINDDAGDNVAPALAQPGAAAELEECPVCFEVMGGACPMRRLACGHAFHHGCIQRCLERTARCPVCRTAAADGELDGEAPVAAAPFRIDLGHQEMAQMVHELEDIFRAVHDCAGPDHPVAVNGLAYNLCTSLGYEDEDELEEALGGSLANFLSALPHFEVVWPSDAQNEPKALMKPEPPEEEERSDGGSRTLFTVVDREDLWRVVLQGPRAEVEIPELEFGIRPKAHRRVDTIYNMLAGAIFDLGDHVQKNKRMGGDLSDDEAQRICETIESLNALLDLEQSFSFVLIDPQGVSELKPCEGVHVSPLVQETGA